jgi:Asp-tRNA(Asn)/Glu-tRNA(Gln) amidotransferase A subunit family amidase
MRPTYGLVPTTGVISIEAEKDIIGMLLSCFASAYLVIDVERFYRTNDQVCV